MNPAIRLAGAAALAAVAILGSLYLLGDGGWLGADPTPSPSASVAPSVPTNEDATPIDTSSWATHVSDTYRMTIRHPADWTVVPSTHVWTLEADAAWDNTASESFIAPDGNIRVSVWSAQVEPGTTLEEWVQAYCEENTTPCTGIQDRAEPIVEEAASRHEGVLVRFEDDIQAFFTEWTDEGAPGSIWTKPSIRRGDQIFVVASWRPEGEYDSRRLIEAFVRSMCIGCER